MCVLVFITFGSIFYILYKICNNKVIALVALVASVYYPVIFMIKQMGHGYYLQYVPHRMIFPCVISAAVVSFAGSSIEKKKFIYMLIQLLNMFSILWNIETGLICTVGTTAFFVVYYWLHKQSGYCFVSMGMVFVDLFGSWVITNLFTLTRAHKLTSINAMFFGQKQFAGGFLSMERPFSKVQISCWFILILFVEVTLARAVYQIYCNRGKGNVLADKYVVQVYVAFLIFGLQTYALFKNSHPYNVTPVIYWLVIIMVLWVQNADDAIKKNAGKLRNLFYVKKWLVVAVISIISGTCVANIFLCKETCYKNVDGYLPETLGFIESHMRESDIELLMINSTYMYCLMGQSTAGRCESCVDWFEGEQIQKVLERLDRAEKDFVIDSYAYSLITTYDNGQYKEVFENMTQRKFEPPIVSDNGNLRLYSLRRYY